MFCGISGLENMDEEPTYYEYYDSYNSNESIYDDPIVDDEPDDTNDA